MGKTIVATDVNRLLKHMTDVVDLTQKEVKNAVRLAVRETVTRTKKKGLSLAAQRYTIQKDKMKRLLPLAAVDIPAADRLEGSVTFMGDVGVPVRYFKTNPKRAIPNWKGIQPKRRKPKNGVRYVPVKGGAWTYVHGPEGQKTFWFRSRQNGNVLLGYRTNDTISSEGLLGPSPIQALQHHETASVLRAYMDETLKKRVEHQLDRLRKK